MGITREHDLHRRRLSRNVGVGLALVGLAALILALTVVKITNGASLEAYDHVVRPGLVPEGE